MDFKQVPLRPMHHVARQDQKLTPLHVPKGRLKLFSWNAGGLSTERYWELIQWISLQQFDIVILQESRWNYAAEWQLADWNVIHSASQVRRSAGLLVLVAKSFCKASHLRLADIIPGRLLHIRLESSRRSIDLIAGYQFVDDRTPVSKTGRATFWDTLDRLLHALPKRNTLVLAGDWNCSVGNLPPHTACASFRHCGRRLEGPRHYDQEVFEQILSVHSLAALNCFDHRLGPTYVNQHQASRIDFICTRLPTADGLAKAPALLESFPLQTGSQGHRPLCDHNCT